MKGLIKENTYGIYFIFEKVKQIKEFSDVHAYCAVL